MLVRMRSLLPTRIYDEVLVELRVQHRGDPYRLLFAFDPQRQAIVLVGGNKASDQRWYEKNIKIAEERFAEHLAQLEEDKK